MHQPDADPNQPLLATADRALAALADSLGGKDDETVVETDARSLRGLASVVDGLTAGLRRCGGSDCFGYRGEGGIRAWAPQELLTRATARADAAEARVRALEAALARVLEQTALPSEGDAMIWDWQGIAAQAHTLAAAALPGRSLA